MTLWDSVRALFTRRPRAEFAGNYQPVRFSHSLMHGRGLLGTATREDALSIPGVLRGRNLICSIATLPLEQIDRQNRVDESPFLNQIDPNVANVVTLAATIEDLLFESVAWWRITDFDYATGYPLHAVRYAPDKVSLNPPTSYQRGYLPSGLATTGVVWMDGKPIPWAEVIRFDSPNPPLLQVARRAIRRAIALDEAAEMYADEPRPMDYFSPRDPTADPGTDDEIAVILDNWKAARKKRSTAYVPAALEYNEVQQPTPADLQLVQLQNRVTLDVANALGIDPEDLGISTTTRTYQNAVDRRKDRVNDVLAVYMSAITQRLTMPDVTPPSRRIRFNLDDYLRADPKTRSEVQAAYVAMGVMGPAYVAAIEGLPPEAMAGATPPVPADTRAPIQAGEVTVGDEIQMSRAGARFSRRTDLTFDGSATAEFAVDTEARTITGLAVPWNQSARSNGRAFRFAPGSLKYSAVNRVKLLRDHNNASAVGKAIRLTETEHGLEATFKVSAGRAGDEVLALAADEVLDGLSIGVDFRDEDLVPDPHHRGGYLVTTAALREISLTAVPAFDDSRLTSVRASDEGIDSMKCGACGEQMTPGVAHTCGTLTPEFQSALTTFMASQSGKTPKPEGTAPNTQRARNDEAAAAEREGRPVKSTAIDHDAPGFDPAHGAPDVRPGDDTSSAYVDDKHPEGRTGPATTWDGRTGPDKQVNQDPPQDAQFQAGLQAFMQAVSGRPVVDPTGRPANARVTEALPYRFARPAQNGEMQFSQHNEHNFHKDLIEMARAGDDGSDGGRTAAGKRVMGLIKATFDVDTADVNELSPNIQRPDLYVDQREYRRPIWDIIGRGEVPGNGTPFTFPKFSSASGLVGNHTEGTEPASGTFVTTDQTITPSALSGKASITRETWTRPGNPATASLIWNQMVRGYWEGLESAAATFLNTLTAATDITLGVAPTDAALVAAWESALADLQFIRGYDFTAFVIEANLYKKFASATATDGRKYYPILNPMNATGQARTRFQTLDLSGVEGIPSWALTATPGALNNSWLIDPTTVYGWASAPERLEFPGTAPAGNGLYAPVAMVDLAIWGWKAFANTDIGGVRQVTYDNA